MKVNCLLLAFCCALLPQSSASKGKTSPTIAASKGKTDPTTIHFKESNTNAPSVANVIKPLDRVSKSTTIAASKGKTSQTTIHLKKSNTNAPSVANVINPLNRVSKSKTGKAEAPTSLPSNKKHFVGKHGKSTSHAPKSSKSGKGKISSFPSALSFTSELPSDFPSDVPSDIPSNTPSTQPSSKASIISVCRCNETSTCLYGDLPQGQDLELCLFAEKPYVFVTAHDLTLTQDNEVEVLLSPGQGNGTGLLRECIGSTCRLVVPLDPRYFWSNRSNLVLIDGTAMLTIERRLRGRDLEDGLLSASFESTLSLAKNSSGAGQSLKDTVLSNTDDGMDNKAGGTKKKKWKWLFPVLFVLIFLLTCGCALCHARASKVG